jgi:SAM-dependent methyltransferase
MTKNTWKERLYTTYSSTQTLAKETTIQKTLKLRRPAIYAVMHKYLPEQKDVRILDLGCGYGAFLYFLKEADYSRLRGVDVSPEQVALAHELGLIEVEQRDIVDYVAAEPDESTDIVILFDVLEHFVIPIHLHPYYRDKYGWKPEDFPITYREFQRLISLPLHPGLTDEDVQDVIAAVTDIVEQFRC